MKNEASRVREIREDLARVRFGVSEIYLENYHIGHKNTYEIAPGIRMNVALQVRPGHPVYARRREARRGRCREA